jgi:hypothetical protein
VSANSNYAGTIKTQFRDDAIRMSMDKFGLIMVASAPKWDIFWYNEGANKYVTYPYNELGDRFKVLFGKRKSLEGRKVTSIRTGKSETIAGLKAEETNVMITAKNEKASRVELWMAKKIQPPPQLTHVMQTLLDIPAEKGLPLRVTSFGANGEKTPIFEAEKVVDAAVPPSTFAAPKNMKRVDDVMQLLMGDDDMGMSDEDSDKPAKKDDKAKLDKPKPAPAKPQPAANKPGNSNPLINLFVPRK